jgi:hypothetical protein
MMKLEWSAVRTIPVWALASTLWLSLVSYQYFSGITKIPETCCAGEQASDPLTFKVKLFTIKGVNINFIYGIDGRPTRITLNKETCS